MPNHFTSNLHPNERDSLELASLASSSRGPDTYSETDSRPSISSSRMFSSPSQVNVNVGSPGASLIVWAIAGVLAWTGAASYAELGGAIPLNGGAQVYLSKIMGELSGFLFTWVAVLVLKPGSAAII